MDNKQTNGNSCPPVFACPTRSSTAMPFIRMPPSTLGQGCLPHCNHTISCVAKPPQKPSPGIPTATLPEPFRNPRTTSLPHPSRPEPLRAETLRPQSFQLARAQQTSPIDSENERLWGLIPFPFFSIIALFNNQPFLWASDGFSAKKHSWKKRKYA